MKDFYINEKWKGIAKGHTAFCILGGPSVNQVKDLDKIIENNFTIVANRQIEKYPNASMYVTADSSIAREFFEEGDFFLHKFKGGKILKNQSHFNYDETPLWVKGKRNILNINPNLIKIIACNDFPCYNQIFTTGQLYKYSGEEYCKKVNNTYLCVEYRNAEGESWPPLSPSFPDTLNTYGTNPLKLMPGGNVASVVFQLLYYMGFSKVITVGYGDSGESQGYENVKYATKDDRLKNSNTNQLWTWSESEIHAMVAHNKKWGDKLKILHGGEICKEYAPYVNATHNDLDNNKKELVDKLIKL